jgi:hypothetical protein
MYCKQNLAKARLDAQFAENRLTATKASSARRVQPGHSASSIRAYFPVIGLEVQAGTRNNCPFI